MPTELLPAWGDTFPGIFAAIMLAGLLSGFAWVLVAPVV